MLAGHVCNVFIQKNCYLSLFNGQVNFFLAAVPHGLGFYTLPASQNRKCHSVCILRHSFPVGREQGGQAEEYSINLQSSLQEPLVVTLPLFEINSAPGATVPRYPQQSHAREDGCKLSRLSPSTADPQVTALQVTRLGQGKGKWKVGADLAAMNAE